ncbi:MULTISPECIES: hypothetical protein [Rheinheimera]|uniref:Uncharacterized protein n=1 Tax=Rheinheimera marina TaxID=1774958 RepID=A0ABV9JK81_9GAMM
MKLPVRWLNKTLFYCGLTGLSFQLIVSAVLLVQGQSRELHWWFHWAAPLVCMLWGLLPALQLQKEPTNKES